MYKNQHLRILVILGFSIVMLLNAASNVFWYDLAELVTSEFESYLDRKFLDENYSSAYSSKFSKDPFGEAMSNVEGRSIELKISWSQYIEELLSQKWCNMSKKEIWGILYYFVPEFRTELARNLKQKYGDYDSSKYVFTGWQIAQYCGKYFLCEKSNELGAGYSVPDGCKTKKDNYDTCVSNCKKKLSFVQCCKDESKEYENCVYKEKMKEITDSKPADVEAMCEEFFKENYNNGQNNKEILQQVEVVEIWADKYWNATTDDSPYDIMSDLWVLSKLLYYGAEDPITPVIYNIPMFSNSKKKLDERRKSESSSVNTSSDWWDINPDLILNPDLEWEEWWKVFDGWRREVSLWWNENKDYVLNWKSLEEVKWLPLSYEKVWYDDLVEWLSSLKLGDNNSNFYTSLCNDEEDEESEPEEVIKEKWMDEDIDVFENLSEEEYQEIVDYLLDAIDDYSKLPEDVEEEIKENAWDVDSFLNATTPEQNDDLANQIKNCWKSCDGLRIDQKASCMLKCACWERSSAKIDLFNSEKTPWLWPILILRFCAVPAVNTNFSVGWKRIHSIEEWLNEIYWVVDQLSREWKLWKWTQQYEFLDSSTKRINVADTFAFSIDIDFVDIRNNRATHSDQYEKKKAETFNEQLLQSVGIANPVDNPSAKNIYRVVWDGDEWKFKPMVDLIEDSRSSRYSMNEESVVKWMDQQWDLWTKVSEDFADWVTYSKTLYTKKS